jgi:hypothetical protein
MAREIGVSTYTIYSLEGEVRRSGTERGHKARRFIANEKEMARQGGQIDR